MTNLFLSHKNLEWAAGPGQIGHSTPNSFCLVEVHPYDNKPCGQRCPAPSQKPLQKQG